MSLDVVRLVVVVVEMWVKLTRDGRAKARHRPWGKSGWRIR